MAAQAKAPKQYYKEWCKICGKSIPNRCECFSVASSQGTAPRREFGLTGDNYRQDRQQRDMEKLNREVERQLGKEEKARGRRPSYASSEASEGAASVPGSTPSECWSVSTAATLTQDEEMQARKLEARLRKINSLQERKAEGKPLTRPEESELKIGKTEIAYAPVMVKVRAGAERCRLDTDPLTRDEEREVRSIEARLKAIKRLQDRKKEGEWLEWSEMAELNRKQAIESSPLMTRVRKGAARCSLDEAAPAAAPVPAPVPLPVPAPVPRAPAQASPPVVSPPQASPAPPAPAEHSDVEDSDAEESDAAPSVVVSTKPQEPTLGQMVATIRTQLGLEDSLTVAQVIAEANNQLEMPATGTRLQQASSLFRELTSA